MLYKQLQNAGLNETEARIYLASLELGQTSVSRIAKKSGVKRTTVYLSVENLMQKGLLMKIKKPGKSLYFAEDPRILEAMMIEKKEKISKLIPELLAFSNIIDKKPEIKYFEGEEGIKKIFYHAVENTEQEMCLMYSEISTSEFDEKFFSDYVVPKRLKKKVVARTLVPDNSQMRALESEKILRKIKFLPPNLFKMEMEIIIYGKNEIGIISFKEKFAIIIKSVDIHNSFQSIFEVLWLAARE